jgi:aspartate 1-decarboxylase
MTSIKPNNSVRDVADRRFGVACVRCQERQFQPTISDKVKMLREYLFAKIHRCVVTDCNPNYMGSISIDPVLLDQTGIHVNERVLVADCENGNRLETYVFMGERGSGKVILNGAAANLTEIGHHVLIMSFCQLDREEAAFHRPKVVICNDENDIVESLEYDSFSAYESAEANTP